MFNRGLVDVQEGKEENESISHLGRRILFLRKPHFSDGIRERDRIRLASCLDGKYIPDVGDSSSPAPSIFKTDHCLFDSCQPVGKTEYHSAPHKEHTHTKSLKNALKKTPHFLWYLPPIYSLLQQQSCPAFLSYFLSFYSLLNIDFCPSNSIETALIRVPTDLTLPKSHLGIWCQIDMLTTHTLILILFLFGFYSYPLSQTLNLHIQLST